jgi:hypothetical protein
MTRRMDAIEAAVSTAAGLVVSVAITYAALPLWGLAPSLSDSVGITALFTGASIVRAYVIRRVFRRFV